MKTCLIFGQNGLDLDVTLNLVHFYRKLGYITVFANKLFNSNLLVVLRAVDMPLDLIPYRFDQIHVYDYGGWNYDGFVRSVNPLFSYIFTTSENTKNHLVNDLMFPNNHVFIALPPVETKLWVSKERKRKYNFVHVGNFKKNNDNDIVKTRFLDCIVKLNVDVWGLWWKNLQSEKYHGKAGLFEVSKIYAQSKFALGLMYPFQREVTFSGRFWHAPLNGCYLLSETGLYTKQIPGIIETTYSLDDIHIKTQNVLDSSEIKKQAKDFWDNNNLDLSKFIQDINCNLLHRYSIRYKTIIFFLVIYNKFKLLYQKIRIFKLWQ